MKKSLIIIIVIIVGVILYFNFAQRSGTPSSEEAANEQGVGTESQSDSATLEVPAEIGSDVEETQVLKDPVMTEKEQEEQPLVEEEQVETEAPITSHTVIFDGQAYSPEVSNIKKGDTVTWINESSRVTWPASVVHPTHKVYPTTGGCIGSTLDACKALENGESFSFTFDEIGTWKMHDHRAPFITMTVVVAE